MVNHLLVSLVNSVIGAGKPTSGDNYSYHCPFCNHYKPKLEINFKENEEGLHNWHCWVCNKKGKKLVSLFKAVSAPDHKLQELKNYVITENSIYIIAGNTNKRSINAPAS